jgi:hypothetical protein
VEIAKNFPVLFAIVDDEKLAAGFACSLGHVQLLTRRKRINMSRRILSERKASNAMR